MISKIDKKHVLKFTLPSILGMLFTSFYTMVDGIFVSNFVGSNALSAINITLPIVLLLIAIGTMLGSGGNAIMATLLGQGREYEAKQKLTLFTLTGLVIAIVLLIILQIFLPNIVTLLGASHQTYTYSIQYLRIMICFAPCIISQMLLQNAMIASGKVKVAFCAMLSAGIVNIILDYVFIVVFNFGLQGASLATSLGFSCAASICFFYFVKYRKVLPLSFAKCTFDFKAILKACSNGASEMVANLANAMTTLLFNYTMLSLAGDDGVAAITIVLYAQFFSNAIFLGYAMGIAPVISYNYGEGNEHNLRALFRVNLQLIILSGLCMSFISFLLAQPITALFASPSTHVYSLASEGLKLFAIGFCFSGCNILTSSMFTAYSNGKISAILSFLRTFGFILLALLFLPSILGLNGAWLAIPIAELMTLFFSIYFIIKYRKQYKYEQIKNTSK